VTWGHRTASKQGVPYLMQFMPYRIVWEAKPEHLHRGGALTREFFTILGSVCLRVSVGRFKDPPGG